MRNPFKAYQEYVAKQPRNSFDESQRRHLSTKFGVLTPCGIWDVVSGDSFQARGALGLNLMPLQFPVQTPIRANVYMFYVRYRNLMKNYKEFRYQNDTSIVHPYIKQPAEFFKTGSLSDFLGVPTTIPVGTEVYAEYPLYGTAVAGISGVVHRTSGSIHSDGSGMSGQGISSAGAAGARTIIRAQWFYTNSSLLTFREYSSVISDNYDIPCLFIDNVSLPLVFNRNIVFRAYLPAAFDSDTELSVVFLKQNTNLAHSNRDSFSYMYDSVLCQLDTNKTQVVSGNHTLSIGIRESDISYGSLDAVNDYISAGNEVRIAIVFTTLTKNSVEPVTTFFAYGNALVETIATQVLDISEHPEINPFYETNDHDAAIRLNALWYRAYEQIYNVYFRNERVEPFIKDGQVQYNDFITTDGDGADETPYHLYRRNWSLDAYTGALPSPIMGTAPVVGVDSRRIEFQDGDRLVSFSYHTDSDNVITSLDTEEIDVSNNVRRAAMDIIANGFTINQLREANAMQIWLERNFVRGLRYKDQVKSHTGVDIKADELDLPEFIGGFSEYIRVENIMSTAATADGVLGDRAGVGYLAETSRHRISRFFDEDGVVIALLCVTPEPVYSNVLVKPFLRTSALDYYNSEFSHLGMQPIPYKEFAPLQMYNAMRVPGYDKNLDSTFGYQRPNYDMVAQIDTAHGLMRTELADWVLMRTFQGVPELGASFLHVDEKTLNDVFQINNKDEDNIFGQVEWECYMKRPVPKVGEPRLQ